MATAVQKTECRTEFCVEKVRKELEVINNSLSERQLGLFEQSRIVAQLGRFLESGKNFPCQCEQPADLKEKISDLYEMACSNYVIAQKCFVLIFRFRQIKGAAEAAKPPALSVTRERITLLKGDLEKFLEDSLKVKHGMNTGNRIAFDKMQNKIDGFHIFRADRLEPIPDYYGNVPEPFTYPADMLEV